MTLTFGSICSGMEAASLAWTPLGWRCAFVAENDKAPASLLAQRFPNVPNHGDVTKFKDWPDHAIDLLVGGTPCQSFSVAGLRKGLADPRGSLMLLYGAIAQRYRPTWLVWENVPGVLSSNGGRDFGAFLGMLAELGYGFAYRVLDAQFFGLAQRRKRVFVVGYLGDWRPPAAVLFERESLRGDSPPRRKAGQDVAGSLGASAGGSDENDAEQSRLVQEIAYALNAHGGAHGRIDAENETFVTHALRADGFDASEDGTGRGTPLVPVAFMSNESFDSGDNVNISPSLRIGSNGGGQPPAIAFSCKDHGADAGDIAPTLRAMGHDESHANAGGQVAVAFAQNQREEVRELTVAGALGGIRRGDAKKETLLAAEYAVRRLTPRECERLQGAPEVTKHVILRVCSDLQSSAALAETKSLKSPRFAWSADGRVLALRAPNAGSLFSTPLPALAKRAAVSVHIDLEQGEVRLHRRGESPISASIADAQGILGLAVPGDAFVRLAVHMTSILASEIRTGEVESPPNTTPSMPRLSGSGSAVLCGRETSALANDAVRLMREAAALKSTTSERGADSQPCDWSSATSSFCVAAVMSGCIPSETREADFYDLSLEVVGGYTLIPYRGKPMADGPRYKMIGNSMAVPVMRWIGERIDLVRGLA